MIEGESSERPDEAPQLSGSQGSSEEDLRKEPTDSEKQSGGHDSPSSRTTEEPGNGSTRLKLQPTYHAQLQEALISEKDIEKVKILSDLLEKEAQREFQNWSLQTEMRQKIELETIQQAKADSEAATGALYISAIVNFLKWLLPAIFAVSIAWWMVSFYRSGMSEAARSLREILLLMIGGALGWIAQAKSDLGAIAKTEKPPTNSN